MERYLCIHGHFYQPPRENPWLEAIELQDSAYPFHDWNERILDECYAPNAASRILDGDERIVRIVNNYARISFNFGATLLQWLESQDPETYAAVLEADRESVHRFSGHGSAIAQAYNHMILPLANRADKVTQIIWGIRDFEHRFGRFPEGMWLPETAVDIESLEIMAEHGIRFTILAPRQARSVRRIDGKRRVDVSDESIDPRRAYLVRLPSGGSINVFFYDGPASRAVAFEGALRRGEDFAGRLGSLFDDRGEPQLVHIATDGETYGHHHRHGDMALAYALGLVESQGQVRLTNYGEFLERHPPTHEAEIIENSSWSCVHGIERWRGECGCRTGGEPGWNQAWRAPLREALDFLRDTVWPRYEEKARELLRDPAAARDDYIRVVLDRSDESIRAFLREHAHGETTDADMVTTLKLMELQRHTMLMYTSCGWFFNELSGIETVQVIQYAGRVIQLAQDLFQDGVEEEFLSRLERAVSNLPAWGNGRNIYERAVRPSLVDLLQVCAHHAIASIFDGKDPHHQVYCFSIDREDHHRLSAGRTQFALGRVRIVSNITRESETVTYGVLHLGDHNLNGGVRAYLGPDPYADMVRELTGAFERVDVVEIVGLLEKHFGTSRYSLRSLFRDEQRRIASTLLDNAQTMAERNYQQLYETHFPLMRFLANIGHPVPRALDCAAEVVINSGLRRELAADATDVQRIERLLDEARALGIRIDEEGLGYAAEHRFGVEMSRLVSQPEDLDVLERIVGMTVLLDKLPFELDLWKAQNDCFKLCRSHLDHQRERAVGDEKARRWIDGFTRLGNALNLRIPE